MSTWREYFRNLLLNRRIMLHLAIWVYNDEGLLSCEMPNLKGTNDYPEIFTKRDIDTDGITVRMSGMFGNATYMRTNGLWTEVEYNKRDNTLSAPHTLSWAGQKIE